MRTPPHLLLAALVVACSLGLMLSGCDESPVRTDDRSIAAQQAMQAAWGDDDAFVPAGPLMEFDDAEVFFEFNTTDNDLGLQLFVDAEGWDRLRVGGPDEAQLVAVNARGPLAELGITEFRFESAEPSPGEVLALFPPGTYSIMGRTVEGDFLMSQAELSHDFLAPPTFSPSGGETVDPDETVVEYSAPGAELVEIIIELDDSDVLFDVLVEGDGGTLSIPPEFLEPGTEYKIELIAYGENNNRVIAESSFVTEDEE